MSDLDLSQALEGTFESGDTGLEQYSCEAMAVQDGVFSLDEGLDLVVSRHRKSLLRVANLIVVLNTMKKASTSCSTNFTDEQLCSMIMENLVDETVVTKVQDSTMCKRRKEYQRVNSGKQCTLCDSSKKDVVQPPGDLELQAITLKGGSFYQKVGFKLASYISPCVDTEAQTVTLSIVNSNWHISCHMKEDRAVLHLEDYCASNLKIINGDEGNDRFLFYKIRTGISAITFESVKYRGWFISTSSEDEPKPVEMCKVDTARRDTCFNLN